MTLFKALFKGVLSFEEPTHDYEIVTSMGSFPTTISTEDLLKYTDPFADRATRLLGNRCVFTIDRDGVLTDAQLAED